MKLNNEKRWKTKNNSQILFVWLTVKFLKYVMRSICNKWVTNLKPFFFISTSIVGFSGNSNYFFRGSKSSLCVSWSWWCSYWCVGNSSCDGWDSPLVSVWHVSFPNSSVVIVWINHIDASFSCAFISKFLTSEFFTFFNRGLGRKNIFIVFPWICFFWGWWFWCFWKTEHVNNFIIISCIVGITLRPVLSPVLCLVLHDSTNWNTIKFNWWYCTQGGSNYEFHV